ncbi:hypothetical protein LU604_22610 [Erwinia tracheiphila]|uniref:Bro-N domain-containing protein n=1 Tax=Erwinia tracheiphila TaxID=65700 RepID=A0A345CXI8_9GAMM|nr:BRO family protein [Erwinia tracheiphila]AXF78155.1 hypothetical protein AV903_22525 [Erwinia tracheiphila]UIA83126.1 hypothetical protein LU604_22610 [Erwinia tracheiphila]
MATQLIFKSHTLEAIEHEGQPWFTAATLAIALEYARRDSVTRIYDRNQDEFTPCMTTTVRLTVVRKTGSVLMDNRIFSLRGAHLIAMFASTPVAKEFRKWVLDLIDKEITQELPAPIVTEEKLPSGVYRCNSRKNPYSAQVNIDGKNIYVGVYPTIEDAVFARHEYLRRHHVNKVIEGNPDIVALAGVNARLLITIEHGQVTYSKIMHPDAITATPDNLPNVLKEYGWGKISIQQHQKIIEACVSVITRRCENLQITSK